MNPSPQLKSFQSIKPQTMPHRSIHPKAIIFQRPPIGCDNQLHAKRRPNSAEQWAPLSFILHYVCNCCTKLLPSFELHATGFPAPSPTSSTPLTLPYPYPRSPISSIFRYFLSFLFISHHPPFSCKTRSPTSPSPLDLHLWV